MGAGGFRKDKGKKGMEITRPFCTSKQSVYVLWKGCTVQHSVSLGWLGWGGGDIHDLTGSMSSFLFMLLGWSLNLFSSFLGFDGEDSGVGFDFPC
jgi:hypothetical protein